MAPKPAGGGRSTPRRRIAFHGLGLAIGSLPVGAVLGALGGRWDVPAAPALVAWGTGALLYAAHEVRLWTLPHPQRARQVPERWRRRYSPRVVAFAYGVLLGPGVLVFVRTAAFYFVVLGVLAAGSPGLGAAAFGLVAAGRLASPALGEAWRTRSGTLAGYLDACVLADNAARLACGASLAALGAAAVAFALVTP